MKKLVARLVLALLFPVLLTQCAIVQSLPHTALTPVRMATGSLADADAEMEGVRRRAREIESRGDFSLPNLFAANERVMAAADAFPPVETELEPPR